MRQVVQSVRQAGYGSLAGAAGLLCLMLALVWATVGESADPAGRGGASPALPLEVGKSDQERWKESCSACHLAFDPHLLPAASWQTLMARLPDHFGAAVPLSDEVRAGVMAWLSANAAEAGVSAVGAEVMRRLAPSDRPDRVTDTRWFRYRHHRISRATWGHPGVVSPANCAACHRDAEQGIFDERSILIPG